MRSHCYAAIFISLLANAAAGQESRSVFLEELTSVEVRDAIRSGSTTIILPTGGTEQNGPHMALGKHNFIVKYTSEEIARRLGKALVAPVVKYVPEGSTDPPSGHMRYPGTITLPNEHFMKLIEFAARSFRVHGFNHIVFLPDSGGNVAGMTAVAELLNKEWEEEETRVHLADDYYSDNGFAEWLIEQGETEETIGRHAGLDTTSELLAVAPEHIRRDKLAKAESIATDGYSGDPTRASAKYGGVGLELKIEAAVRQIRLQMQDRTQ
jgi:creatinine amidohydrolase/Fe(II)-dependent formamide hydrolase-like protein